MSQLVDLFKNIGSGHERGTTSLISAPGNRHSSYATAPCPCTLKNKCSPFTVYVVQCTLFVKCTLYNVYTLRSTNCTVYNIHVVSVHLKNKCNLSTIQCTMYGV